MTKYYLDKEGTQRLVDFIKDQLGVKVNYEDLEQFATKDDLSNVSVDLSDYASKSFVNDQIAGISIPEAYDDSEIKDQLESLEAKTSGLYHFKGSVADLAALLEIVEPEVGDTYNLADTGMNAAWTGSEWDQFGTVADLTGFVKEEEVVAITKAELNAILFSGKSAIISNVDSLLAVLANDQPEVEITLNDDLQLDAPVIIPAGKEVVLNLAGNEISSGNAQAIVAAGAGSKVILSGEGEITSNTNCTVAANSGGEVVIDGATIISTNSNCAGSVGAGSKLTLNSGKLQGQEYGLLVIDGGDAEINGGTLAGVDNFALGGNGSAGRGGSTVTINGGVLEGHITSSGYMATAIYWPNEGTLNINGGVVVTDGAGLVQRGGTVNIGADAVFMASNNPVNIETGKAGDSRNVVGRYAVVYDYNSKYPAYESMQLNIAEGAQIAGIDGDLQILPENAPGIVDNRL